MAQEEPVKTQMGCYFIASNNHCLYCIPFRSSLSSQEGEEEQLGRMMLLK